MCDGCNDVAQKNCVDDESSSFTLVISGTWFGNKRHEVHNPHLYVDI